MGSGRQGTRRVLAAKAGDVETAEALKPPSEKRLQDHEICGALTQSGNKCRSRKGSRTDHPGYGNCVKHGGNTQAGIKSAMREMGADFMSEYKQEFLRFGGDRRDPSIANMTPEGALLEEVRRSAAMVRYLEERIAMWNLSPAADATIDDLMKVAPRADAPTMKRHITEVLDALDPENPDSTGYLPPLTETNRNTGITSFTDAREWLYLYREERGHLARVSKMCIDAGVANRIVTLAEDQGRILASALRVVLQALDLSPAQSALVPQIVPRVLRAVASDQPVPDISTLLPSPEPA